jgi:hypothetical protein
VSIILLKWSILAKLGGGMNFYWQWNKYNDRVGRIGRRRFDPGATVGGLEFWFSRSLVFRWHINC